LYDYASNATVSVKRISYWILGRYKLGGPTSVIANDIKIIKSAGYNIGLHLTASKCEQITKGEPLTYSPFCEFIHYTTEKATLLGAQLSEKSAMTTVLLEKLEELRRAANRLSQTSAHDTLILLRASAGAPKLTHVLRSSPCKDHLVLFGIDTVLRECLSDIVNVNISDDHWKQASLPVNAGGLDVRSLSAIASSVF